MKYTLLFVTITLLFTFQNCSKHQFARNSLQPEFPINPSSQLVINDGVPQDSDPDQIPFIPNNTNQISTSTTTASSSTSTTSHSVAIQTPPKVPSASSSTSTTSMSHSISTQSHPSTTLRHPTTTQSQSSHSSSSQSNSSDSTRNCATHSSGHGSSSTISSKKQNEESDMKFICELQVSGKDGNSHVALLDDQLIIQNKTPKSVCMSKYACEVIVRSKLKVKSAEYRGFCKNSSAQSILLSDRQIEDLIERINP